MKQIKLLLTLALSFISLTSSFANILEINREIDQLYEASSFKNSNEKIEFGILYDEVETMILSEIVTLKEKIVATNDQKQRRNLYNHYKKLEENLKEIKILKSRVFETTALKGYICTKKNLKNCNSFIGYSCRCLVFL